MTLIVFTNVQSRTFISFLPFISQITRRLFQLLLQLPLLTRSSLSLQQSSTSLQAILHRSRKCRTLTQTHHVPLLFPRGHLVISTHSDLHNSSLQPFLITASGSNHCKHHLTSFIIFIILTIFVILTVFPSLEHSKLTSLSLSVTPPHLPKSLEISALSTFINHSHNPSHLLL